MFETHLKYPESKGHGVVSFEALEASEMFKRFIVIVATVRHERSKAREGCG